MSHRPSGEETILQGLKRLVVKKTGLQLSPQEEDKFRKIVFKRMGAHKIHDPNAYYNLLLADSPEIPREWQELTVLLTTGETFFFRDQGQFQLMKRLILPELIKVHLKERELRIWSAGCSSGEEPYSLAMVINDLIPDCQNWNVHIIGTDINQEAIKKAERGLYTQWSFRKVDPVIQRRFFHQRGDGQEINDRIRGMVKFHSGNLLEGREAGWFSEIQNMDLILCRNVFIYFTSESAATALQLFKEVLDEGGYLLTGHGELHRQNLHGLGVRIFLESVVYQKIDTRKLLAEQARVKENRLFSPESGQHSKMVSIKATKITRIRQVPKPVEKDKLPITMPSPSHSYLQSAIEKDFLDCDYMAVIEKGRSLLEGEPDNFKVRCLIAESYANLGQYDQARDSCEQTIALNTMAAKPYFLLAQIAEAQGRNEEAMSLLKKVIYLESMFVAAYLELGNLYERENDTARTKKMRNTVVKILENIPSNTPIEPYKEMTAGELLRFVKELT